MKPTWHSLGPRGEDRGVMREEPRHLGGRAGCEQDARRHGYLPSARRSASIGGRSASRILRWVVARSYSTRRKTTVRLGRS